MDVLTAYEIDFILDTHNQLRVSEIANRLGLDYQIVYRYMLKEKIPMTVRIKKQDDEADDGFFSVRKYLNSTATI